MNKEFLLYTTSRINYDQDFISHLIFVSPSAKDLPVCQTGFTWTFMNQGLRLNLNDKFICIDSISNMKSIFGLWNDNQYNVYMAVLHVSSDFEIIFMVDWSRLSFQFLVCVFDTRSNRSTMFGVWNKYKICMSVWQRYLNLT